MGYKPRLDIKLNFFVLNLC